MRRPLFTPADRPWLHLLLFLATCVTTTFAYYSFQTDDTVARATRLGDAGLFTFCVLLILGAHEMGHYLMARRHGVDSSLPYFIPFPFGFGTMGAVIRIRARIPTRDALVDIGAAGPLAGLLIAVPLLVAGTVLSHPMPSPGAPPLLLGPSSLSGLFTALYRWFFEHSEPTVQGVAFFGDNLLTLLVQRLVKGPLPAGTDLAAHPVFLAAWFGLLVTMFNLFPIGQLDGGHLTHAWFGPRAIPLGKAVTLAMATLVALCSFGWIPWMLLTSLVIGYRHPEVIDPAAPLSRGRKVVCAVCFVLFALTLMPVPITAM
jgi:membrane-associated protease RseP (regulator of RpoE activity)